MLETNLSKDPTANPPLELERLNSTSAKYSSDAAKIRQLAQIQHKIFYFQDPGRLQEFQNLAPQQQDQLLELYNELCGQQNPLHQAKTLTITLNVDQALNSAYAATYNPHLPVGLGNRSKIILKLQASNKTQNLTTLRITDINYNLVNLERTSKLYKKPKANTLEGLTMLDSAVPAIKKEASKEKIIHESK